MCRESVPPSLHLDGSRHIHTHTHTQHLHVAGGTSDAPPPGASGSVKHIGNKAKRQEMYRKYKQDKKKARLERRIEIKKAERGPDGQAIRAERLATNKPRTIENTRDYNPTIINAPNTHEGPGPTATATASAGRGAGEDVEQQEQEAASEEEDDEDPSAPPAILITTSMPSSSTSPHLDSLNARSQPAQRTREFIDELLNVFPGAEYRPRSKAQGVGLGKICGWARARRYGAVLVVGESRKEPFALTLVGLPHGPTAFFRLTSITLGQEITGKARSTGHTPELILNNFTTVLGHRIGGLLQGMFPKIPQLEGRQVVTCHNQRDYIFFRRHRYMFKNTDKTALQEIGPRFTLKLHSLKDSLPKGAGVWDGKYTGEFAEIEPDEELQDGEKGEDELAPESDDDDDKHTGAGKRNGKGKAKSKQREVGEEQVTTTEFQWKVSGAVLCCAVPCRVKPRSPCDDSD